ncbi:MAG: hypothetical protein QOG19_3262 [Mycobacterium sp.]|nr:hypothetical protein [Mycobacterium sp.]
MRRRRWVAVGAAAAVAAAIAVGLALTAWFDRPAPSVPNCRQTLTAPVTEAVRSAFATLWNQRHTDVVETRDSSTCYFDASSAFSDATSAERGTPRSRSLSLHLVQEDPRWFQARQAGCRPPSNTTGFADERGLGDEAFSCWATHEQGPFTYVDRYLYFRVGNLSFLVTLGGANYGPQSAIEDIPQLRTDLQQNTRCIAEALAKRFDAPLAQTCAGTARDM